VFHRTTLSCFSALNCSPGSGPLIFFAPSQKQMFGMPCFFWLAKARFASNSSPIHLSVLRCRRSCAYFEGRNHRSHGPAIRHPHGTDTHQDLVARAQSRRYSRCYSNRRHASARLHRERRSFIAGDTEEICGASSEAKMKWLLQNVSRRAAFKKRRGPGRD